MKELFLKKQAIVKLSQELKKILLNPKNTELEKKHLFEIYKNEFNWAYKLSRIQ